MKRALRVLLTLALGACVAAALLLLALCASLRPAPGEWTESVRVGPWHATVSMPALLRITTHPLVLQALDGRTLPTRWGRVQWHASGKPLRWRAVCAPCRVRAAAWGDDALLIGRVELVGQRDAQDAWHGEFLLGEAPHIVRGRFTLKLESQGLRSSLVLPDTPLADAYRVFGAQIPELRHARIDGRLRLQAQWRWPERTWQLRPQIKGFAVSGLGTEALQGAAVTACPPPPSGGFGAWLPRAVLAAEDQRFYEHQGVDLDEMVAAWTDPSSHPRGASTLTQQLARLLVVGGERSPVRKLRELLYAVELDRTLGKARVLHLYLAMAPWGDGQCGAAAASRHYLRKRVDKLTPIEAAWLASLLHNPEREWAAVRDRREVNLPRVAWVLESLRPMPPSRREVLLDALPAWAERFASQARPAP